MSDEIDSPPYPLPADSVSTLYRRLTELVTWANAQHDELLKITPSVLRSLIPRPKSLVTRDAYTRLPVTRLWSHYSILQDIRKKWDSTLRVFESDWDTKEAMRSRIVVLQTAVELIADTRVPQEAKEAKPGEHAERLSNAFDQLFRRLDDPEVPIHASDSLETER